MVTAEPLGGAGSGALSVTISTFGKATAGLLATGPNRLCVDLTTPRCRPAGIAHPADSITTAGLIRSVSVAS
jgi:hypothetical protein